MVGRKEGCRWHLHCTGWWGIAQSLMYPKTLQVRQYNRPHNRHQFILSHGQEFIASMFLHLCSYNIGKNNLQKQNTIWEKRGLIMSIGNCYVRNKLANPKVNMWPKHHRGLMFLRSEVYNLEYTVNCVVLDCTFCYI